MGAEQTQDKATNSDATIEMQIPGLCCVECCQGVDGALRHAVGVEELRVLGTAEKVLLTYDPALTSPEELVQVVERSGERVTSWRTRAPVMALPVVSAVFAPPQADAAVKTAPFVPAVPGDTAPPDVALPTSHAESTTEMDTGTGTGTGTDRHAHVFALLRLAFVGVVALIALVEIAAESLGLLRGVEERIPAPLALAAVVLGGYPIFRGAYLGLRYRQVNTDAVMSVGILAAAAIHEFVSSALIVFFVIIAHSLEDLTTGKARRAIAGLTALMPRTARIRRADREEEVPVEALRAGDLVLVRAGERIPIDGTVQAGHAAVNQAAITGESLPVEKDPGDPVFAATINEGGYLEIAVERVGEETTLGRIIQLVEEAESHKAPVQRFADRFSALFLPLVLTLAAGTFLVTRQVQPAIAVLVAACPCAVGLATPLSVVAAVGAGARRGLLVKGGLALETLAKVDTLVVDKTGTLTHGRPVLTDLVPLTETETEQVTPDELLASAAALETYSDHPLARAVRDAAAARKLTLPAVDEVELLPSRGVLGTQAGQSGRAGEILTLGARRLLAERGLTLTEMQDARVATLEAAGKSVLLLARGDQVLGALAVADTVRADAPQAITALRRLGVRHIVLLTGDNERVAAAVAREAGIGPGEVRANLLPQDKIAAVKALQAEGRRVAMVGDGVNDAPALTQADVGIAMGQAGTDIAMEAADVVLLRDDWTQVPEAIRLGRRTYGTIRQNIFFGIGFTVLVMGLAATSVIGPILAAASQSVPDVAVALNASRLLGHGRGEPPRKSAIQSDRK